MKARDQRPLAITVVILMASAIAVLTTSLSSIKFSYTQTNDSKASNGQTTTLCGSSAQSIRHVLIVASDGMRADTLEDLNHPVIQELTRIGFYTRGLTQPGHYGARIEHGTGENVPAIIAGKALHDIYGTGTGLLAAGYSAPGKPLPSTVETLFELANRHHFYSGFVYSKSKAASIANPEGHQVGYARGNNSRDDRRARNWAIEFVKANAYRKWYLLVWFSEPDYVQVGASDVYRAAVARNLDFLATIIDSMKATCAYYDSIIALTADHGMSDSNGHHGRLYWNDPRVYEVPWLVAAPSLKLVHKMNGPHYNHELSATVSHLAWDVLPTKSDSIVWLEGRQSPYEQQTGALQHQKILYSGIH